MKIKGAVPRAQMTHSRGVLVYRYTKKWGVVVAKWPRRRPGILPQVTQDQVAIWDMAQEFVRWPEPSEYATALKDTLGTAFYARDILISAMYGNYISWPGWGWRMVNLATIQQLLDAISTEPGAMLVRADDGWVALLPAAAGEVLTDNGPGVPPSFQPLPAAPSSGLYASQLSARPTIANTGLAAWLNQGGAAVADTAAGLTIAAPLTGGNSLRSRYKASPSSPYTITALLAANTLPGANNAIGIGWYDGSNKLQTIAAVYSSGWLLAVQQWSNSTTFNATNASSGLIGSALLWLQIQDDGTNAHWRYSIDGVNFMQLFTVAKASGYLGSSGYANVLFFCQGQTTALTGTIISWSQS